MKGRQFEGGNPMKGGEDGAGDYSPRRRAPTGDEHATVAKPVRPARKDSNKTQSGGRTVDSKPESKEYSKLGIDDIELGGLPGEANNIRPEKKSRPVSKVRESKGKLATDDTRASIGVSRFKGANPLQYTLWAHFMAYGSAMMGLCVGIFSIAWTHADAYGCKVDNKLIHSNFLFNADGTCPTTYLRPDGSVVDVCCRFDAQTDLEGYFTIGVVYIVYSIIVGFYENTSFGYGLWFPNDSWFYRNRVSPIALAHLVIGIAGLYNYATCMGGAFFVCTAVVQQYGVYRNESGDGGRDARLKAAKKLAAQHEGKPVSNSFLNYVRWCLSFNPISFCRRIRNEDKLSSYVWVGVFIVLNIVFFLYTLDAWYVLVMLIRNSLLDGSLSVQCSDILCHVGRKAVKYGPVSLFAPWAKGCGVCLDLNCALLLLPVLRMLLRKLHNYGASYSTKQQSQQSNDICNKFFAHPLTRYLPLQKNIEFHKICAVAIFFFTWGHIIFHFLNLITANNITVRLFRFARWDPTDWVTGGIATLAMLFIYSAAPDIVRYSKYEIFLKAHYFFVLFFIALFLHGPDFFYWTAIPVLLYIAEKFVQGQRGNRPYLLVKAEWISPVIALYFRPLNKEDFVFREGQYLYLNCPAISPNEWHPFTISSAFDDLATNPARICLETGEDVIEVPRPKGLPQNAKWSKYCLASQDWTKMDSNDFLEKSETGYYDYISLHIKVFGLEEPHARTWTRKFKEYLEVLSPGKKFPFYFSRRDSRGDVIIGKQFGPDGMTPILRVDGPHAAPAEHYANYGTLMLIGAGIGLTPCVSILSALTKYRWRKNFNPEILHFYWVIRQSEIESYQWLVHLLTDNSFELKRNRASGQIDRRYYCEIHIYVTGVEKDRPIEVQPLYRPKKSLVSQQQVTPSFTPDQLYHMMVNPTVDSIGQIKTMKEPAATNRLQDIWIWNGRPNWDEIFKDMRDQRQHSDIGVCFCGAAPIGADLRSMCEKYSSVDEDCMFSLHKENF
jgi:hypothetical protein